MTSNHPPSNADRQKHINAITDYAWSIRRRDPERAAVLAQEAFAMADSMHYVRGLAESMAVRGAVHMGYGQFDEAILASTEALHLFDLIEPAEDRRLEPYVMGNVAESYLALHDFESALAYLERQLHIATGLHDDIARAQALKNLSRIYAEMDDHSTALSYLEAAVRYGVPEQRGELYNLLAQQSMAVGDIAAARSQALEGLDDLQQHLEFVDYSALVLLNATLAEAALAEGQIDDAREYLQTAWQNSHETNNANIIVTLLMQFGKLCVVEGDTAAAVKSYQRALAFATARDGIQRQYQCHEALAALYEMSEEYAQALHHHKNYAHLRRQALHEQNALRIHHLEMLMRTRISQQEARFYEERSRQLETLRARDRDYFEELSNIKDDMMRTASHDLKNPLSTVMTLCYTLRKQTSDPKQLRIIDRIEHQTERMKNLIVDLLDLAKLETGRSLETDVHELNAIVLAAVADVEPLANAHNIKLAVELEPRLSAEVDASKLRQVLDNLLSNAIKYSPPASQVLVQGLLERESVVLQVQDNGLGIPAADLPFIFERFYRVTAEEHQNREGTGLGLTIVKTIVEQHNGKIAVESRPGIGTTFTIHLPLAQPSAPLDVQSPA